MALCVLPGPAFAQSENIIVTATRLAGEEAGSNVSIIDAQTIQARNLGSVVDLLRDLPGVFVQQSGGSVVSLFTRGAKPNFTLVLLDGVKANDPTNTRGGSYDFSTLDLNDITRIEFVRGPASAIYGSDAVGGVINIITRRGGNTRRRGSRRRAAASVMPGWRAMSAVPSVAPRATSACPTPTMACRWTAAA